MDLILAEMTKFVLIIGQVAIFALLATGFQKFWKIIIMVLVKLFYI